VRLRLRPRGSDFYTFFSEAAKNISQATEVLAELANSDVDHLSVSKRLVEIEHQNDELTHHLYNKINATFITPFDREDLYRLGARLDDVVDHLEAAGTLVHLYGVFPTPGVPPEMADQLTVLGQLGPLTVRAFDQLPARRDLKQYWVEANRLENEADRVYRNLLVRLFGGEFDALTVLKLKEVADELEEAADAFEQVANTVEAIIVKES
jgi:predicted phosphate transport protein (TIGR00153 family)